LSDQTPSETTAEQARTVGDGPLLVSISEAAGMLGISRMTVIRRIRSGSWRSGRCGKKHLLSRAFVEAAAAAVGRGADVDEFAKSWFEQGEAVA
jgi:excisionase family DNA binding protein